MSLTPSTSIENKVHPSETSSQTNQLPSSSQKIFNFKGAHQLTSKSKTNKNTKLTLMNIQMDNTTFSLTPDGDERDEDEQENSSTTLRHETENDDGTALIRNNNEKSASQLANTQPHQQSDIHTSEADETGEEATAIGISLANPGYRVSAERESATAIESKSLPHLLSSSLSLKTQRYESSAATPYVSVEGATPTEDPSASIEVFTDTTEVLSSPPTAIKQFNSQASIEELVNLPSSLTSSIVNSLQNSLGVIATGIADQDLSPKTSESTDGVILRDSDKQKNATRLSVRAKKKSWYNVLYPNYKSRAEDFKKLFKEVPNEERLIVDYSCALQREILLQGRMYVSQNYVCFHANIFRWETYLSIKWKDVESITKEKTALVIPNAISICTAKEKYFFATFTSRDKAFLMLFRVWQNTLMKKPMPPHEVWQWVHNCYGDELGLTTDDEDYIDPNSVQCDNELDADFITSIDDNSSNSCSLATADNNSAIITSNSNQSINQLGNHSHSMSSSNSSGTSSDTRSTGEKLKTKNRFFSKTSSSTAKVPQTSSSDMNSGAEKNTISSKNMPVNNIKEECADGSPAKAVESFGDKVKTEIKRKGVKNTRPKEDKASENLPTDMSASSDSDGNKIPFVPTVACDSPHEGRQIVHTILPINIETVFNIMFENSKFMIEFHKKRHTEDFTSSGWKPNKEGTQTRICNLTVQISASVGPKTSRVTDEQVMRPCSKPGELYSIDCVTTNAGIPYADSFNVLMHFCLVRTADDNTMLSMHAQIKYRKSIWGVVKSLIEKNTWTGVEEFYASLVQALQNETNIPPAKGKGRRQRRALTGPTRAIDDVSVHPPNKNEATPTAISTGSNLVGTPNSHSSSKSMNNEAKYGYRWLSLSVVGLLVFLLALNALLLHKLWQLETRINNDVGLPNLTQLKQLPNTNQDWMKLLHEQEVLHERELQKWHTVLQTAIELLRKVSVVCKQIYEGDKPIQSIEQVKDEL